MFGEQAVVINPEATLEALTGMGRRIDPATIRAIKKSQSATKSAIKGRMRSRPRWDHRGRSGRTGPAVNLNLNPHHVTKNSGPGKLSGSLVGSIRGSKTPRKRGYQISGAVLSGSYGGPQNLYKKHVEAKYPYFAPGVKRAEKKLPSIWEKEWGKAIESGLNAPIRGATE